MDANAAKTLRELFISKTGQYPYLLHDAQILFQNAAHSKIVFTAKTPSEAANILQHCVNNDGASIFNRNCEDGTISPISLRMNKRVRLSPDNKEHMTEAFQIHYQSFDEDGHLWIADLESADYYWLGDEKIDKNPPMTFSAPRIHDLIETLRRAGDSWHNVNFISRHGNPTLRLVQDNTAQPSCD